MAIMFMASLAAGYGDGRAVDSAMRAMLLRHSVLPRCRACVVPIDPCLPPARIDYMLADAGVRFLIIKTPPSIAAEGIVTLLLRDLIAPAPIDKWEIGACPDSHSHVIYTYGACAADANNAVPLIGCLPHQVGDDWPAQGRGVHP